MILAGSALTVVSAMAHAQVAHAQATPTIKETPPPPGTQKGLVTVVDRLNNTVAIRAEPNKPDRTKAQDGAKAEGEKAEGAKEAAKPEAAKPEGITERFKIDPKLVETVHAGDKVKFSVSDSGDPKTITKIGPE
ncbi:MAG: hypothetical protein NTAFB05_30150 [Nitrobacter sp.]